MLTILHIEDDHTYAELIRVMLAQYPADLAQVTTIDAACTWLAHHTGHLDLIIADIAMRGPINGLQFVEALRQQAAYVDTPVIFLSAIDAPSVQVDAYRLGPSSYLTKPIPWAKLLDSVEAAIANDAAAQDMA